MPKDINTCNQNRLCNVPQALCNLLSDLNETVTAQLQTEIYGDHIQQGLLGNSQDKLIASFNGKEVIQIAGLRR